MGSTRVVPSPSPLSLPLPGFKDFRRGRFDHRGLHRDNAKNVVQAFADQRAIDKGYIHLPFINNDENSDNGNGNGLGLEGPRHVSERQKGLLSGGCFI